MIIPVLGFSAIGVGLIGVVFFIIKNGREIKKRIAREIEENRK